MSCHGEKAPISANNAAPRRMALAFIGPVYWTKFAPVCGGSTLACTRRRPVCTGFADVSTPTTFGISCT